MEDFGVLHMLMLATKTQKWRILAFCTYYCWPQKRENGGFGHFAERMDLSVLGRLGSARPAWPGLTQPASRAARPAAIPLPSFRLAGGPAFRPRSLGWPGSARPLRPGLAQPAQAAQPASRPARPASPPISQPPRAPPPCGGGAHGGASTLLSLVPLVGKTQAKQP